MVKWKVLILVMLLGIIATANGGEMYDDFDVYPTSSVIYADANSREVYSDGDLVAESKPGIWFLTANRPSDSLNCDSALVLAFKLPARPTGKLIEARALMFYIEEVYLQRLDRIDLYGLKSMPASTPAGTVVDANDYFFGDWAWDSNAVALDRGVLEQATCDEPNVIAYPWRATSAEGSLRLSCWLNSLYDNGAQAGDYAVLRLNGNEKYSLFTRIKIHNMNSIYNDNVRIYYDLVDDLSASCPPAPLPDMVISSPLDGDVYPNVDSNDDWMGPDGSVTFADFATIAEDWLKCDRVPSRLCD